MIELGLCIMFLLIGVAVGYAMRPNEPVYSQDDTKKKIDKLEQELAVYKNLKESLLNDIRYWRSKAEGK